MEEIASSRQMQENARDETARDVDFPIFLLDIHYLLINDGITVLLILSFFKGQKISPLFPRKRQNFCPSRKDEIFFS